MLSAILTIMYWLLFNQMDGKYRNVNGLWAVFAASIVGILMALLDLK